MTRFAAWCMLLFATGLLAGCAGAAADDPYAPDAPALQIVSPSAGAHVDQPFTVELSASVPLGPPGSDRHHVRVYVDGIEGPTVTDGAFEVDQLVAGPHAIHVSLFDPDGTLSGAEDEVRLTVTDDGDDG